MLNNEQKLAVESDKRSALVLAGAGAGKTKVLVARLVHLIEQGTLPEQLMAVTFTNKAANEMRERLEKEIGESAKGIWLGTFHSICYKMLCIHCKERFKIISQYEQLSIIKRFLLELELEMDAKLILNYINAKKDAGERANPEAFDIFGRLYCLYQDYCHTEQLVDFGELLLRCYELLQGSSHLKEFYQSKFDYVLVDEFQDTNIIQYEFLKLLTSGNQNLFVVGDDDQSIYGWRGARIENLYNFQTDYLHDLIKLERNYRCSNNVLKAANSVIAHNEKRMGKVLWTDSDDGELIDVLLCANETLEAAQICKRIKLMLEGGELAHEIAVLYRSHALVNVLQEQLLANQIPFQTRNGKEFYSQSEIRIVLGYLRVSLGQAFGSDFEFLSSTPPKGIGRKTREVISQYAGSMKIDDFEAARELVNTNVLKGRANQAVKDFLSTVDSLKMQLPSLSLSDAIRFIVRETKLVEYYKKGVEQTERIDNLRTLFEIATQFKVDDSDLSVIEQFLNFASLSDNPAQPKGVQLMTIHASKGLEFNNVFVLGLEQGTFPAKTALLEEERRLMYVAITRARHHLTLCCSKQRTLMGNTIYSKASRFLSEIPKEILSIQRFFEPAQLSAYPQGCKVIHPNLGEGIVVNQTPSGLIEVNFSQGNRFLTHHSLSMQPTHSVN